MVVVERTIAQPGPRELERIRCQRQASGDLFAGAKALLTCGKETAHLENGKKSPKEFFGLLGIDG